MGDPLNLHAVIAIILSLWSSVIGDDEPMTPLSTLEGSEPVQTTPDKPKTSPGRRIGRGHLPLKPGGGLDIQAFQASFKRQAGAELLACFRQWKPSPDTLGVTAELNKSGRLSHFAPLDSAKGLPDCAMTMVAAMDFTPLAKELERETMTIQWRIDW